VTLIRFLCGGYFLIQTFETNDIIIQCIAESKHGDKPTLSSSVRDDVGVVREPSFPTTPIPSQMEKCNFGLWPCSDTVVIQRYSSVRDYIEFVEGDCFQMTLISSRAECFMAMGWIYIFLFAMILMSLESKSQLSDDIEIVANRAILGRFMGSELSYFNKIKIRL